MSTARNATYLPVFLESHGPGPWPCDECSVPITSLGREGDDAVIHHEDGDPANNDPDNLKPMHRGCHAVRHHRGRPRSEAERAAISAATRGKPKTFTPEAAAALAEKRRRTYPDRKRPDPKPLPTHCARAGHEMTTENSDARGRCRECRRVTG